MILDIPKVVREWSYLVNDGMPDTTNTAHLIKLGQLLIEMKYDPVFVYEYISNLEEAIPDNVLKKKIKNPKTGRQILVSTGLGYKGGKTPSQKAGYGAAKQYLDDEGYDEEDIKSAEEKGTEPEDVDKGGEDIEDTEAVESKEAEKFQEQTFSVLDNSEVPEHKEVKRVLEKLWSGKTLSGEEKEFLSKWIRVVEPSSEARNPEYKFYVANKEGHFSRSRKPAADKIPPSGKRTSKAAKELHSWMQQNGVRTQRTSTFGGKKTTANQTYVDKDGKTKLLGSEDKPAATVQRDTPDSSPTSITIGDQVIKRQDDKEAGISGEEGKRRRRHNRNLDEYAKAIEDGTLDFIDMNEGVTPDSPENRVTVIKSAVSGMVRQMRKLAEEPIAGQPAPPLDDEAQQILDDLEEFANRDPNEDSEQWMKDFDALMSRLSNHEVLTEGWANYAEVYTAIRDMHDNGKGTENGACVLLPESTTLETVDTIVISTSGEGERKIVTLDGVSVKKGVGGASALTSKVEKSVFKPVGDLSKEEVKKTVVTMSESHTDIYKRKIEDGSAEDHKEEQLAYREKLEEKARSVGVSEEHIEQIRKEADNPKGQVANALKKIMSNRKNQGLPVDRDTEEKVRQRLVSYYIYQNLSHQAYNQNVDVQDFSNESVNSQTKTQERERRIDIDSSDGVDILAYPKPEFNVGFTLDGRSRNPGSGRFHNKKKD